MILAVAITRKTEILKAIYQFIRHCIQMGVSQILYAAFLDVYVLAEFALYYITNV